MATTLRAPQITYTPESLSANPKYRFLRVPLNNLTGTSFTLTATSSQMIEFKMPNSVFNLSQSYLQYEVDTAAQGGGGNHFAWMTADCLEIASNAYFGTASGLDLCNLNYVNRYTKVMRKAKTKLTEMLANDGKSQLKPSNALTSANYYPVAALGTVAPAVSYIESRYLEAASGDNAVGTWYRQVPLKAVDSTIFSLDKDLYFGGQDMYVRFTIGPGNFGFHATSNTDPTAGATALNGNITIQSCYLWLAVEQNPLIVESVMQKVLTSGLRLNIPYTTAFRNSSTGTVANINIPLTSQYGKKLKRMVHTVWHGTETANTALDCSNYNQSKIATYNTFIDSRQLQDATVSTAVSATGAFGQDDWRENSKYFAGSCILNASVYALNWCHIDQFYESNPMSATALDDNHDDGLDMSTGQRLWQMQSTTANGTWSHYDFATFVREIEITKTGVQYIV